MEEFGFFLGRTALAIGAAVLAGLLHWMNPAYIVLYVIGIFFGAIATELMCDHNGVARIVIFTISSLLLIIPAFILLVTVLARHAGGVPELLFFPLCVTSVVVSWFSCGKDDIGTDIIDLVGGYAIALLGILIWLIWEDRVNVGALGGISLAAGLIEILVLIILRIKNGSALYY